MTSVIKCCIYTITYNLGSASLSHLWYMLIVHVLAPIQWESLSHLWYLLVYTSIHPMGVIVTLVVFACIYQHPSNGRHCHTCGICLYIPAPIQWESLSHLWYLLVHTSIHPMGVIVTLVVFACTYQHPANGSTANLLHLSHNFNL